MPHPNEIQLVQRTPEGLMLPTRYYRKLIDDKSFESPAHVEATMDQASRQAQAILADHLPVSDTSGNPAV